MEIGSKKSNIILQTGNLFEKIKTKFVFNHKIVILDQVSCVESSNASNYHNNTDVFVFVGDSSK